MSSLQLKAALEAFVRGDSSSEQREIIRQAFGSGQVTLATGERAMAVGGDANGAVFMTGDGNALVSVTAFTAEAVKQAIASLTRPSVNQLPDDLSDFQGRKRELRTLKTMLTKGKTAVVAIHGMPGVGKSALALRVAHQLGDAAPQGRIFLELGGTSPQPLTPLAAVIRVLQILQPEMPVPTELELAQSRYRSCLDGKHALLLLDNVEGPAQVAPLLKWRVPTTLIIVTSRLAIADITNLKLKLMKADDERGLLQAVLRDRIVNQDELDKLANRCGHLPLALRVAGTFLALNPDWTVEKYDQALKDERNRPELLRIEGHANLDVYAVLGFSARQLSQGDRALADRWRMLAVFPASFDRAAAAAVWGLKEQEAHKTLSNLLHRNMIMYDEANDRYRLHDLMRDVAWLPLEGEDERTAYQRVDEAAARHARHFCGVLTEANGLFMKGGKAVLEGLALYDLEQRDVNAGQAWAVERMKKTAELNKEAAKLVRDYSYDTYSILSLRLHSLKRMRWFGEAIRASRLLDDKQFETRALGIFGNALVDLGKPGLAIKAFVRRLQIAERTANKLVECEVLGQLGSTYQYMGKPRQAIYYFEQRLKLARDLKQHRHESDTLGELGGLYQYTGEAQRAIDQYKQRLRLEEDGGDLRRVCSALGALGSAYRDLGELDQAIKCYERRLRISSEIPNRHEECFALGDLGSAYQIQGQLERARDYHERRRQISRELGDRRLEGHALAGLGNTYTKLQDSVDCHNEHLKIAREIGDRGDECLARRNLGLTYAEAENIACAIEHHNKQLDIARKIRDRRREGMALRDLGNAYICSDEKWQAIGFYEEAVRIARKIGDRRGEAGALRDGALAFDQLDKRARAVEWLKDALAIQKAIQDPTIKQTRETLVQWGV